MFLTSAIDGRRSSVPYPGTLRKGGCVGSRAGVGGSGSSNIRTVPAAMSRMELSSTAWSNYLGKHMAEVTASDTGYYAGLF